MMVALICINISPPIKMAEAEIPLMLSIQTFTGTLTVSSFPRTVYANAGTVLQTWRRRSVSCSLQVHDLLMNIKFEAVRSKLLIETQNTVAHKPVAGQRPQKVQVKTLLCNTWLNKRNGRGVFGL